MKRLTDQKVIYPGLVLAMGDRGMTQADIARALGLTRKTIQKKLSGKSRLHVDEAVAIMGLFPGWTLDDLFVEGTE